jgi:hypothetical protein
MQGRHQIDLSFLLRLVKYVGVLIAGAYGIYATVTEFYVVREGERVLSTQGRLGIGLLLLSTLVALLSDVLRDIKENRELEAKAAQERKEREDQLLREKVLLDQLDAQLDLTKTVSNELQTTAAKVEKTSETTSSILQQELERIEYFEIELFIDVAPLALTDENGNKLLSERLVRALESEKQRGKELPVDLFEPIVDELRENYDIVRRSVFKSWELNITLDHATEVEGRFSHDMWIRQQMEDGVASFVISHVSGDEGAAVQCWMVYRVPPNRAAGFRTFKDFNGALLELTLEADPKIVNLTTVRMNMDAGGGFKPLFLQSEDFEEKGDGYWAGTMQIPSDHF